MALQHFLLSPKARTLTLKAVYAMGEDGAYQEFCRLRWPETDGEPVCPRCGCPDSYPIAKRRRFKCVGCAHQFSVTSGTIFANRKLPFSDLLAAILLFVNGAKGVSAIRLSHDLGKHYKTAWVLAHKLREAMGLEAKDRLLGALGIVEIDGMYVGGYVKPENQEADRVDRRLNKNRTGKRQTVAVMRERGGKSLALVAASETASVPMIRNHLEKGAVVFADEGTAWDALEWSHETQRVNHSLRYYDKGVCTNQAESYNSRLRRAEIGTHHLAPIGRVATHGVAWHYQAPYAAGTTALGIGPVRSEWLALGRKAAGCHELLP